MGRQLIYHEARTSAAPAAVYELLRDGARWPTWSPVGSFELERPGDEEKEGVGAIRVFRSDFPTGEVASRVQIAELVPDRRLGYRTLSGLPAVRDYRGEIELEATDDGTVIRWRCSFLPTVPWTGRLARRLLGNFVEKCIKGLSEYAAAR
jgi:hypothetical protein